MLSGRLLAEIAEAMFERGFEEGNVPGPPFAGVDECIGGILADEICIRACIQEVNWCRRMRGRGLPCNVNFPGFCESSESGVVVSQGANAYLAEDAYDAVTELFGMIGRSPTSL